MTMRPYTILQTVVGSVVHGLNLPSNADRDEMGICLETIGEVIGPGPTFEQLEYRTAVERTGNKHAKSEDGDLDLVVYGLRKWMKLALAGNPSVIVPLFVPDRFITKIDARGSSLLRLGPHLISKQCGHRHLGYLTHQYERLIGQRGQKDVKRPELVEKYGYDTKFAMHALRLGFQGIECMETGRLELPMEKHLVDYLLAVRQGKQSFISVVDAIVHLQDTLINAIQESKLPEKPDMVPIERFMHTTYLEHWKALDDSWQWMTFRRPYSEPERRSDP